VGHNFYIPLTPFKGGFLKDWPPSRGESISQNLYAFAPLCRYAF
jgi:hypothetical protein